jgi:hypothetical protein
MDQGESTNGDVKEHAAAFASVFHSLSIALILQAVGIKSAYLFSNVAFAGLVVMSINEIVAKMASKSGYVSFVPVYLLWNAMSIIFGVEAVTSVSPRLHLCLLRSIPITPRAVLRYLCTACWKVSRHCFTR